MTHENNALESGIYKLKLGFSNPERLLYPNELEALLDALSSKPQKVDWDELGPEFNSWFKYYGDAVNGPSIINWFQSRIDKQQTQPNGGMG